MEILDRNLKATKMMANGRYEAALRQYRVVLRDLTRLFHELSPEHSKSHGDTPPCFSCEAKIIDSLLEDDVVTLYAKTITIIDRSHSSFEYSGGIINHIVAGLYNLALTHHLMAKHVSMSRDKNLREAQRYYELALQISDSQEPSDTLILIQCAVANNLGNIHTSYRHDLRKSDDAIKKLENLLGSLHDIGECITFDEIIYFHRAVQLCSTTRNVSAPAA